MRIFLGFLCGFGGLIVGWAGAAFLTLALAGMGNDGGIAMAAFFQVGPLGGLVGAGLGVWLCRRLARPAAP